MKKLKTSKKLVGPHILHGTQYMILCPSETPDGEQIGINKNLALTCYITNQIDPEPVIEVLKENNIEFMTATNISNIKYRCKIFAALDVSLTIGGTIVIQPPLMPFPT